MESSIYSYSVVDSAKEDKQRDHFLPRVLSLTEKDLEQLCPEDQHQLRPIDGDPKFCVGYSVGKTWKMVYSITVDVIHPYAEFLSLQ